MQLTVGMAVYQKITICWYLLVLFAQVTSEEWTETIITDFSRGLGGMSGQCLGRGVLVVKKYEDFVSVFEKPFNANDFFATSSEDILEYCIESAGAFTADVGYEIGVLIHTGNVGVPHIFSLSVINTRTSEVLTDVEEEIYEENWTYSIIKIKQQSSYKIRLEYTKIIEDDDNFFAIDKFIMRIPLPPTTTPEGSTDPTDNTSTSEAPTTDPTDNTSPTDAPTTDPTDYTSPTEAPTTDHTDNTPPTEPPTTDPTDKTSPTEAPTTDPTDNTSPTEAPATDPTDNTSPTEAPTTDSTDDTPPTEPPTTDPTNNTPTEAPTTNPTDDTPPTEAPTTNPTDDTPPTETPTTDLTDGSSISETTSPGLTDNSSPATDTPIIISPESDKWKTISIVALTICGCLIVFTGFLVYFYFSAMQKILPKKSKVIQPIDPRVVQRKEDATSDGSAIRDMPGDQKPKNAKNIETIDPIPRVAERKAVAKSDESKIDIPADQNPKNARVVDRIPRVAQRKADAKSNESTIHIPADQNQKNAKVIEPIDAIPRVAERKADAKSNESTIHIPADQNQKNANVIEPIDAIPRVAERKADVKSNESTIDIPADQNPKDEKVIEPIDPIPREVKDNAKSDVSSIRDMPADQKSVPNSSSLWGNTP